MTPGDGTERAWMKISHKIVLSCPFCYTSRFHRPRTEQYYQSMKLVYLFPRFFEKIPSGSCLGVDWELPWSCVEVGFVHSSVFDNLSNLCPLSSI
jgi:hypothetical protein